jgi:ABC-type nitrate/sulfonate/bicarbonate transport system substrate-binding protein
MIANSPRPEEIILQHIDLAERQLAELLSNNPQFAKKFLNALIDVLDWTHQRAILQLAQSDKSRDPVEWEHEGRPESKPLAASRGNTE